MFEDGDIEDELYEMAYAKLLEQKNAEDAEEEAHQVEALRLIHDDGFGCCRRCLGAAEGHASSTGCGLPRAASKGVRGCVTSLVERFLRLFAGDRPHC